MPPTYGTLVALGQDEELDPRRAYASRDAAASRAIHERREALFRRQALSPHAEAEAHVGGGEALRAAVYGAVDGVLTAFAILSGAAGGGLPARVVLVLGASNLVADAISMGCGEGISTASYREHVETERRREEWEFETYPEGEIEEMVDLYESRGLPRE